MTNQKMIALTQKKDEVLAQIAKLGPMRRGSLVSIYRKCGKPNCHCAVPGSPGHGPSWPFHLCSSSSYCGFDPKITGLMLPH